MNTMFGIREIDVHEFNNLKQDSEVVLVDVRTEAEIQRGGIDGAMHVPLYLLPMKSEEMCKERPTVIYCHSGARSAQACAFMASKGFDNVFNLRGGILAWVGSGNSLGSIV
ncbi:MAG: rhodanese-like domain-containing protein [Sulfuricellaceae bacterium]|nr:rhodanese-like domain-containing protein [Sulfuricellaceae bacterium]